MDAWEIDLITGVRVGLKVYLNILNRTNETLKPFIRIVQQRLSRNDQLPSAIPNRSAYQAVVGVIVHTDVHLIKGISSGDSSKSLMFTHSV